MRNPFIESFNGRLRDEILNETLFTSLMQARLALEDWRRLQYISSTLTDRLADASRIRQSVLRPRRYAM
jgi:transposase InsO family protein